MPSFSDLIENKFLTDEQLWGWRNTLRSLSPGDAVVRTSSTLL